MRLKDKVALITGAASPIGIGYSISMEFAKEGAFVIAADISDPSGTVGDIKKMGLRSEPVMMDVSDEAQVNKSIKRILEDHGRIDILVNNAGICPFTPFLELTKDIWDITLDVNLTGVFLCSLAVARNMVENRLKGKIINISSMCVEYPSVNQTPYAASKGGVYMLAKNMALELAPYHINVNSIAPAGMATNIVQRGDQILDEIGRGDKKIKRSSLADSKNMDKVQFEGKDRPVCPYDIARAAVFLASEDAAQITGQTIFVNGFNFIR